MVNKIRKSFTVLLIALLLIPFSSISVLAESAQDEKQIEDGTYKLGVKFLKEGTTENSTAANFIEKEAIVNVNEGKMEVSFSIPKNDDVNFSSFSFEGQNGRVTETNDEYIYIFSLNALKDIYSSTIVYEVPSYGIKHEVGMDIKISGLENLPVVELEQVPTPSNPEPSKPEEEDNTDNPEEIEPSQPSNPEQDNENNSIEDEEKNKDEEQNGNNEEIPSEKPNEKPDVTHGLDTFTYSYDSGDVDLTRYYTEDIYIVEKDGKEYLQLKGKGMRNFIEMLYLDSKHMKISAPINDSGSYFAEIELDKPLTEKNTFKFTMIINVNGNLMVHSADITLNLDSKEKIKEGNTLIKNSTEPFKTNIVTSNDVESFVYTTEGANISGSYEREIEIVKKDGKQFLQLHGKSMRQFVDGLYIDGKRMNIGSAINDKGAYVAQIELDEKMQEKNTYNFDMLINTGRMVMHHNTKINLIENLKDGEYSIEYDALYADKNETSTAAKYFVNPTKIVAKDGKYRLFIKLTDNETIKDIKVKAGEKFQSAKVESINEEANTRIVSFEVDNLIDEIDAKVKVDIPGLYTSEQPFRIVLKPNTIDKYNGNLENDEDKLTDLKDGEYTINFRTLHETSFEKVPSQKYLKTPAKLEVQGGKNIVTITVDKKEIDKVTTKIGNSFKNTKIVNENKKNKTYDVQFTIDSLNEVVYAQLHHVSKAKTSKNIETVRLFFEKNSVKLLEEKEEERKPLVADRAYTLPYKILHVEKDELSAANSFFTKKAVILEYNNETYVQITTEENSSQFIKSMKNLLGGKPIEMVKVSEENGVAVYQFKVDQPLTEIVQLKMILDVPGVYENKEHDARLVFDTSKQKKVNPEKYTLVSSTNANGPDGDNAQTPQPNSPNPNGNNGSNLGTNNGNGGENNNTPSKSTLPDEKTIGEILYSVVKEDRTGLSIADQFFLKPAYIYEEKGKTFAEITIRNADMVKNISNKFGEAATIKEYKENGILYRVIKLQIDANFADLLLTMDINVPGLYNETHTAYLVFDKSSYKEILQKDKQKQQIENMKNNSMEETAFEGSDNNLSTINKPGFGNNAENNVVANDVKESNPKTSDMTAIVFYTILLIIAGGVLVFQIRKNMVKE